MSLTGYLCTHLVTSDFRTPYPCKLLLASCLLCTAFWTSSVKKIWVSIICIGSGLIYFLWVEIHSIKYLHFSGTYYHVQVEHIIFQGLRSWECRGEGGNWPLYFGRKEAKPSSFNMPCLATCTPRFSDPPTSLHYPITVTIKCPIYEITTLTKCF